MSDNPKAPKSDNQTTFFLQNRHIREETIRANDEDKMITRAMGGPLAEQDEPDSFRHVLNIACGTGGWIIEVAKLYPQMSLVGIDINSHVIDFARENAATEKVAQRTQFQVMDALRPLEFPDASFDLINLRLGVTFIRTWEWPNLVSEMLRVARPGGVIRLTEPQIIHENLSPTSKPGHAQWHNALVCAMYRSGHLFKADTTGLTAHLAPLLTRFGCKEVQTKSYALEFKAKTPEWKAYYNNGLRIMQGSRPFLTKWGCISKDHDALCQLVNDEMLKPDYHMAWNFVTVWSKTPKAVQA